ncbi:S1 family peptidase [Nonomuraea sediminis]|uniref:S1 family peptidase n=1 Tax=Nonomuraea sediminis TaxID=2835864 RepID=UPI001BDDC0C5|nr:S1 family peptidase [Nonomuraea sediminis]
MNERRRLRRVLYAMLIAVPATMAIAPVESAAAESDRTIIILPRESQPVPKRPTLETIKRSAEQRNISLAQGIDEYVAHEVAANPSATARAKEDGVDPAAEPELKIDDLPLSELNDLKLVVRDQKITLEEAIERIAWQPRLNEIGAALERRFPAEISGLAVLENGLKAQIGFKGKIPDYAVQLAKALPVAVELVGNKGFSQSDLKQARDAAYASVAAKRDVVQTLMGGYDTDTGVVEITVKPRVMPKDGAARQAMVAKLQPAQAFNAKISINVRLSEKDLVTPQDGYMRGGGSFSGCTTGFNIINGYFPSDPSARLTATAAHCGSGGGRTYCNHPAQGDCTTSNFSKRSSTYDIGAWTRGTFVLTRTFYYDYNKPRYVYYEGSSPAKGQNICSYGDARQYAACANIKEIDVSGPNAAGLIIMDRSISVGGDSGGPWYKSNTAWGIHYGLCGYGGEITSCFTPVALIASALNGTSQSWGVWTAPPGA